MRSRRRCRSGCRRSSRLSLLRTSAARRRSTAPEGRACALELICVGPRLGAADADGHRSGDSDCQNGKHGKRPLPACNECFHDSPRVSFRGRLGPDAVRPQGMARSRSQGLRDGEDVESKLCTALAGSGSQLSRLTPLTARALRPCVDTVPSAYTLSAPQERGQPRALGQLDGIAHADRAGCATAAWTPKGSGSVASMPRPIGGQRLQRVRGRARPSVRVLRRHRTATDVPPRHDDRLSEPHAKSEPFVFLSARASRRCRSSCGSGARRPRPRRGSAPSRAGSWSRGASPRRCVADPWPAPGPGRAERFRPANSEIASLQGPPTTRTSTVVLQNSALSGAVEADLLSDRRAVGKRERQRIRFAVVLRDDLLENAEALAVDEAVRSRRRGRTALITRDSGPLSASHRSSCWIARPFDRAVRDPGDTRAQAPKPT